MTEVTLFKKNAPPLLKCARSAALIFALLEAGGLALDSLPEEEYSDEQKQTLSAIFQDSLDISVIHYKVSAISDYIVEKSQSDAFTLGNTIHLHSRLTKKDSDPYNIGSWVFVHENAHIWQNQNCNVRKHSLFNALVDGAAGSEHNNDTPYMYTLDENKDLSDYNHEQQASIIADYSRIKGAEHPVWLNFNQNHKKDGHLYEAVLKNFHQDPSYIKAHCENIQYSQPQI
tara:strand:+ start:84095 stop:84781 length:687 start_codon:yes stop_codon:yes gene_type:complete